MALLAPLTAAPTLLPVSVGEDDDQGKALPSGPMQTPRVVVRFSSLLRSSEVLAPNSARQDGRVYVVCEGATWDECAWAMEHTRTVLVDVAPVVAGRSVAALALDATSGPDADRDAPPPVFVGVDIYRLLSV